MPDTPSPVSELAAANTDQINDAYSKAIESSQASEALEAFSKIVREDATLSINMRAWALSNFMVSRLYMSAQEFADELAKRLHGDAQKIDEARQDQFYSKRQEFERLAGVPPNAKYAALNIGGDGLSKYGEFCIIVDINYLKNDLRAIYLAGDSLKDFNDNEGNFDMSKIASWLSLEDLKHKLATIKNKDIVCGVPPQNLPKEVCKETNYIEAIFEQELNIANVSEIRVSKLNNDAIVQLAIQSFTPGVDNALKAVAIDYVQIKRFAEENSMNFVVLG